MFEEFYLDPKSVPEIFRIADREMEKRIPKDDKLLKPREIPMPYIDSNPNVEGPLYVTNEWYFKKKKKRMIKKAKERRDVHIEMMQLLAKKDMLRIKLGHLDPEKKKDAKKIVAINVDIKDIDAELEMLSFQSGINLKELDHGTRLARFVGRMKRRFKKAIKKAKRFWEENSNFICDIALVTIPVLTSLFFGSRTAKT